MDFEDDRDFWDDIPTYSSKRVCAGSRSHTGFAPRRRRPLLARAAPGERDPFLARIATLAGVGLLLVPVALTVGGGGTNVLQAGSSTGAMALPNPVVRPVNTVVIGSAAPDLVPTSSPTIGAAASPRTAPAHSVASAAAPARPSTERAVTPVAAGGQTCAQSLRYTLVAGDYWIAISRKTTVKLRDLLAANRATVRTPLYPGRTICLPAYATPTTSTSAAPVVAATEATTAVTLAPATTTPAATTTTTTTLPARTYTAAEVEAIIREVWPDDLEDEAVRIARRESSLKPTAKNYCCYGVFQLYFSVHKRWLATIGVTSAAQLFDPRVNATAALALHLRNGWGPWQ